MTSGRERKIKKSLQQNQMIEHVGTGKKDVPGFPRVKQTAVNEMQDLSFRKVLFRELDQREEQDSITFGSLDFISIIAVVVGVIH